MKQKILLLSLFILTLTFFAQTAKAQSLLSPGMPDPSFGIDGRVIIPVKTGSNFSYTDTVLQPDGKILVLATTGDIVNNAVSYRLILIRLNANGTIDSSFGTDGISNIPVEASPQGNPYGKYLYVLPDGKIIIIGTIDGDFGLFRVDANGSLDTSFGVNGIVRTNFADSDEISTETVRGFIVRPDGRFIVYGHSQVRSAIFPCQQSTCLGAPVQRFAIAQYNTDGVPDGTFGSGGLRKDTFFPYGNDPSKAFLDTDGKLSIIGAFIPEVFPNGTYILSYGTVRYDEYGAIDYSYGTNGLLNLTTPQNLYTPLQNGKFVANVYCGPGCGVKLTGFNSDFSIDTTFGTNGVTYYSQDIGVTSLDVQPDGKFIFSGYSIQNGRYEARLRRYNANGTIDNTFKEIVTDLDGENKLFSRPSRIVFQPDGKILVASPVNGADNYYGVVIMRFIGRNTRSNVVKISNVKSK